VLRVSTIQHVDIQGLHWHASAQMVNAVIVVTLSPPMGITRCAVFDSAIAGVLQGACLQAGQLDLAAASLSPGTNAVVSPSLVAPTAKLGVPPVALGEGAGAPPPEVQPAVAASRRLLMDTLQRTGLPSCRHVGMLALAISLFVFPFSVLDIHTCAGLLIWLRC
jgi:hypothetical protein